MNNKPEAAEDDNSDRYTVPGLERGLRLLCEFSRHEKTLSAPELAKRLDVPRSTVFRLLTTLERMGFVERSESGRDYRLGMAVLRLGFEYLASLELTEIGRPLLERLRDVIGHSTTLVVRDGRSIVYVAKSVVQTPFVSSVNVGTRLPAHATVLGRVLLEDLTLPQLRELYPEEHLQSYTEHTPATVLDLFNMVQQDRERGYVLEKASSSAAFPPWRRRCATAAARSSPHWAPPSPARTLPPRRWNASCRKSAPTRPRCRACWTTHPSRARRSSTCSSAKE